MLDIVSRQGRAISGEAGRGFGQAMGGLGALLMPVRKPAELNAPDGGLHLGHAPIGADALMQPTKAGLVLAVVDGIKALAVILQGPGLVPERLVIGHQHAAFATCGDDLVLAKGKGSDVAEPADRAALVTGAHGLARNPRSRRDRLYPPRP